MRLTASGRLLGARLGLLAFVLIALAPLFSQLGADTRDWSWLAELACHQAQDGDAQPAGVRAPTLPADACGYCSLLSHCPALVASLWLPLAGPRPVHRGDARLPCAPPSAPHFPRALSRAPPMPA